MNEPGPLIYSVLVQRYLSLAVTLFCIVVAVALDWQWLLTVYHVKLVCMR